MSEEQIFHRTAVLIVVIVFVFSIFLVLDKLPLGIHSSFVEAIGGATEFTPSSTSIFQVAA